jgi:hypothetical protein
MPLSVTIGAGEGGVVDACGEFGLVRGVDQAGVVDPGRCRRLGKQLLAHPGGHGETKSTAVRSWREFIASYLA